ncbi:MAG: hypothetical protein Q9164_001071 [Protoblastenia rupestris]
MPINVEGPRRVWVTLLTRASYLPGVITLAFSLSKQKSLYPLVVLVTPSLPKSCLRALELESKNNALLIVHPIEPLLLPAHQKTTLIASRFEDTWTKLRAFQLTSYDTCIFLDADITIYRNMDHLFDFRLPGKDWIAANHSCVCNLDHDSFAASNWGRENCPYTPLRHHSSLNKASPIPESSAPPDTYALLNGGLFLYYPSEVLWGRILHHFNTSPALSKYMFPDQDFLADFFCHKWLPLPWKYNAIKTMENWHRNLWRDEAVHGLHYIVDKPWSKRLASDGIAGHLGRDGKTHGWWWNVWEQWARQCEKEALEILEGLVAEPLNEEENKKQCEDNRKKGFPVPIRFDSNETSGNSDKENEEPNGTVRLRKGKN